MEKTLYNLRYAFIYEAQIRSLYEAYAKKSNEEGYYALSNFFKDIAQQKKQHANWCYLMLQKLKPNDLISTPIEIGEVPPLESTSENLNTALRIQDNDWRILFNDFANIANEEGLLEISSRLKTISNREKQFFERFKIFSSLFDENKLLKNESVIVWECQGCGFQISKMTLPDDFKCPSCGQLKNYFQKKFLNLSSEENVVWECMECGEEVSVERLPTDFKCSNCGKSKEYFRRKKMESVSERIFGSSNIPWVCMECGNEVYMHQLPKEWTCINCGASKQYFRRKSKSEAHGKSNYSIERREQAIWRCPVCGKEIKVDLPDDWKCPSCGNRNI
ncbi:MAG: hypothetical protein EU541_03105 [Promethearchaeota archaeon]|nr:MAG: hypothetical protein EU541_03105 [Candidatus Lokiarchaeota archaeon]